MKAAIYTRVSSEEQVDGHSLSAQAELVNTFASSRGWQVVHTYEERGRSGKSAIRPEFQRMIRDAELRLFDVIIVHKLDRFSRSIGDTMTYLKRLQNMDVGLVSVTEDFDFTTPHGKLMLGLVATFAEWYLDNLSQETSKGKHERARQGGWNGTLPFGYSTIRRIREMLDSLGEDFKAGTIKEVNYSIMTSRLEATLEEFSHGVGETDAIPCPINASGVTMAFEAYSQGIFSDMDIANLLNSKGYHSTSRNTKNPFGKDTVTYMLQNRFYIGETSYKGIKKGASKTNIPGRHIPLISAELFDKTQEMRVKRSNSWSRGAHNQIETYPLSSVLVCVDCGSKLRGWKLRADRRYRDPAKERGIKCPSTKKSMSADNIEEQVANILKSLKIPDNWQEQALEMLVREQPKYAAILGQRTTLQSRQTRLKDLFVMGDLTEAEYKQKRDDLNDQIADIEVPVAGQSIDAKKAAHLLKHVDEIWNSSTLEEREEWFKLMFNKVYVSEGVIKAIEPTPVLWVLSEMVPRFDTRSGDDGIRTRDLCLDRAIC